MAEYLQENIYRDKTGKIREAHGSHFCWIKHNENGHLKGSYNFNFVKPFFDLYLVFPLFLKEQCYIQKALTKNVKLQILL